MYAKSNLTLSSSLALSTSNQHYVVQRASLSAMSVPRNTTEFQPGAKPPIEIASSSTELHLKLPRWGWKVREIFILGRLR